MGDLVNLKLTTALRPVSLSPSALLEVTEEPAHEALILPVGTEQVLREQNLQEEAL